MFIIIIIIILISDHPDHYDHKIILWILSLPQKMTLPFERQPSVPYNLVNHFDNEDDDEDKGDDGDEGDIWQWLWRWLGGWLYDNDDNEEW